MLKRVSSFLMALVMVVSLMPTAAFAANENEQDSTDNGITTIVSEEATETNDPEPTNEAVEVDGGEDESEPAPSTWYDDAEEEFTISTAAELAEFAEMVNGGNDFADKTVYLGGDVDLSGMAWTPIGPFYGAFDGRKNTVSGLSASLFGTVGGTVVNVTVVGTENAIVAQFAEEGAHIAYNTVKGGESIVGGAAAAESVYCNEGAPSGLPELHTDAASLAAALKAGGTVELDSDVDLSSWTAVDFSGTLDGNGYTITGLKTPLFSTLRGTVKNLTIEPGAIVGIYNSGCCSNGKDRCAGAVAAFAGGSAKLIDVTVIGGSIDGSHTDKWDFLGMRNGYTGGLVGYNEGGMLIDNCEVRNVNQIKSNNGSTGGFVGHTYGVTIKNSRVSGNTVSTTYALNAQKVGVVIGTTNGTVKLDVTEEAKTTTAEGNHAIVGRNYQGTVEVTGGSYFTDPTAYNNDRKEGTTVIPEGYELVQENGMWGLKSTAPAAPAPDAWYNETDTEFTLNTVEELQYFASLVNGGNTFAGKTVKLGANINLENVEWAPIGDYAKGAKFCGTFDGNGKTISNLNVTAENYAGLFGVVDGTVKNLTVDSAVVAGKIASGVIAGQLGSVGCTIENCKVIDASVTASYSWAGAVVGENYGIVKNCIITGGTITAGGDENNNQSGNAGAVAGRSVAGGTIEGNVITGTTVIDERENKIALEGFDAAGVAQAIQEMDETVVAVALPVASADVAVEVDNAIVAAMSPQNSVEMKVEAGKATETSATYEIELLVDGAAKSELGGTMTISLPIPSGLIGAAEVYHVTDNGRTPMGAKTEGNNVVFETNHLSTFEVAAVSETGGEASEPTTWDGTVDTTWYAEGTTSYEITTAAQLAGLAKLVNEGNNFKGKTVKLAANIDLNNQEWTPIGYGVHNGITQGFQGTFDGNEKTISNLKVTADADKSNVGLFGIVGGNAEASPEPAVKNLTLTNVEVLGYSAVAGICGKGYVADFDNCHVNGDISIKISGNENYVGGIVGYLYGNVTNSTVIGTVGQPGEIVGCYAGGIVGWIGESGYTVNNCTAKNLSINGEAGGIIGLVHQKAIISNNTVENCVITSTSGLTYIGLVAGDNRGSDKNANFVINNSVNNTTASTMVGDEKVQVTQSAPLNEDSVIGTEVTLDETGKVTGGNFEVAPPQSTLAEGVEVKTDENGSFTVAPKPAANVAEVSGKQYPTLQEAIDNAEAGQTVTLYANPTEAMVTVKAGKNVVIDFNGKTLNGSMMVEKGATADIKNGTITQSGTVAGIEVQGVTTLTNMTITSARHAIRVDGLETEGTHLTINSGTYQSNAPTSWTAHAINAGEGSTVIIKDGTFIGAGKANAGGTGNCVMVKDAATTVTIEDGTFTDSNGPEGCISPADKLTISGGTFGTWNYDQYLAEGKAATKIGETYKVVDAVAKIGDKLYGSVQDAVNAVTVAGTVINVIADTTEQGTEVEANSGEFFVQILDKEVTIDLGGYTFTGSFYLNDKAKLTIDNGKIRTLEGNAASCIESVGGTLVLGKDLDAHSSVRHAIRVKGGTATINGGTYKTTAQGDITAHALNISHASNVTVNNGTFKGSKGFSTATSGNAVMIQDHNSIVNIYGGDFSNAIGVEGPVSVATGLTIYNGAFDDWYTGYDKFVTETKAVIYNAETARYILVDAMVQNTTTGKRYGTMQDAIDGAKTGETIKLLDNITINAVDGEPSTHAWVKDGQNVIIDLNGKTVTGAFYIDGTAKLMNGTILNTSDVSGLETQGNLTLENMTITSNRHAVRISGGTTEIVSGTYTTNATSGTKHAVNISDATVTIKDGTFTGYGTSTNGNAAVAVRGTSTLTIEGGEFSNDGGSHTIAAWGGVLNISGGIFHKAATDTLNMGGGDKGTSDTGITGGIFEDKPDTALLQTDKAAMEIGSGEYAGWYEIGDAVAMIGTEPYASIQDAIDNAKAGANEIKLLADTTETVITVASDDDVVIDLGGFTVNGRFWVNGKATIKNGTITNTDKSRSAIEMNSTKTTDEATSGTFTPVLVTEDLTITSARHAIRVDGGKATIINGTYKTVAPEKETAHGVNISSGATVVIKDGTFVGGGEGMSDSAAVASRDTGTSLTIEGGNFSGGTTYDLNAWGGEITVKGGHFGTARMDSGTIEGGYFESEVVGVRAIKGGTFKVDPAKNVLSGYASKKITEGEYIDWYEIVPAVAAIDDQGYATLAAAITAANAGQTIKLIADIEITDGDADPIIIEKDLTIDFGKHTLFLNISDATASTNNWYGIRVKSGNVTFQGTTGGIKTAANGELYAIVVGTTDTSATLTIEGGSYIGGTSSVSVTKGDVTINGGSFAIQMDGKQYNLNCYDTNYKSGEASIVVNGGSFEDWNPSCNAAEGAHTNFAKAGFIGQADENGWYTLVEGTYVAQTETQCFATLAEAAGDTGYGDKITLLADANVTEKIRIKGDLDLGGHTITVSSTEDGLYVSYTATISNGKIVANTPGGQAVVAANNTVLDKLTIEGDSKDGLVRVINSANLTVNANTTINATGNNIALAFTGSGDVVVNGTVKAVGTAVSTSANTTGNLTINKDAVISGENAVYVNGGVVKLNGGTYTGALAIPADKIPNITKAEAVTLTAPKGYEWNNEGKLVEKATGPVVVDRYAFGQTAQIGLIEPWFLKVNAIVADDDTKQTINYSTLKDFGVYMIRGSEFGADVDLSNLTYEDFVNAEGVTHYANSMNPDEVKVETKYQRLTASYTKGLYTYEMSDPVYVMFYTVDQDGAIDYAPIKEYSVKALLNDRKDDTVDFTNVLERNTYKAQSDLEAAIVDYRAQFIDIDELPVMTAPTLENSGYQFAAETVTSYKFGRTVQLVLIEPWGMKVNSLVADNDNQILDCSNMEDYGVIVYYDVDGKYTSMTPAQLMAEKDAYVFSKQNGQASIENSAQGKRITATYNKDIFTYQLNSNAYVMFFVKDENGYHYSVVDTRNVYQLAQNRAVDTSGDFGDLEKVVYEKMAAMYEAITAYRDDYFENN